MSKSKKVTKGKVSADNKDKDTDRGLVGDSSKKPDTESKVASSMDSSGRYTDTCQRCGRPKHTGTCRTPMALPVGSTLPLAERVANEKSVVADPKASLDESKPSGTGVAPKR